MDKKIKMYIYGGQETQEKPLQAKGNKGSFVPMQHKPFSAAQIMPVNMDCISFNVVSICVDDEL